MSVRDRFRNRIPVRCISALLVICTTLAPTLSHARKRVCLLPNGECDFSIHLEFGLAYGTSKGDAIRAVYPGGGEGARLSIDVGTLIAVSRTLHLGATIEVASNWIETSSDSGEDPRTRRPIDPEPGARTSLTPRLRARYWPGFVGLDVAGGVTLMEASQELPGRFGPSAEVGLHFQALSLFVGGDVLYPEIGTKEVRVFGGVRFTLPAALYLGLLILTSR